MRNNSETDRNASAQYKVKSVKLQMAFTYNSNGFKKPYRFLKYARANVRKDRYAPENHHLLNFGGWLFCSVVVYKM